MKLKSYYMDNPEAIPQPTVSKPKKKYQSKKKGYTEDQDFFLYTSHQDEQEALQVTSARFTVNLDYDSDGRYF